FQVSSGRRSPRWVPRGVPMLTGSGGGCGLPGSLGPVAASAKRLEGRRVFITGAARGVGALLAKRLTDRGASVALAGIEPDQLAKVSAVCMDAPVFDCDVTDRSQVEAAVQGAVEALGGLDVAVAN